MDSWWNRRRENELRSSHEETANTRTYPASGLTYGDNTPTVASMVYIDGKSQVTKVFLLDGYLSVLRWKKLSGALWRKKVEMSDPLP